ncbi:MAG TPA: alpha/beta fold hydrolase [Burkholderiales bacterium]|jgi:pimeloyl-ACP methyl ester carboxylesterase|nr:alpha/beta fold hydrolase [Burkholderiales bacterium]
MSSRLRAAFLFAVVQFACTAWAAPCIAPPSACVEWVSVAGGSARAMVYRNHAIDARNDAVTQALIVIHGQGRDADNYYRHALAAGFLAGALDRTLIIAPRFASNEGRGCRDSLAQDELNWVCVGPASWRSGGASVGSNDITSFDLLDDIMQRLAKREVFPNLRSAVLLGHSAGGQYVMRYELANRIHDRLPFPLTYVVANPSSYTYPDSLRPTPSASVSRYPAGAPGYTPVPAKTPPPFVEFADAQGCTNYNAWPYGLDRRVGFAAKLSDEELNRQLAKRPVTYLLGELDILPLYGFDSSCAAMAQGPTRLARGLAFAKYMNDKFGAHHQTVLVPACGHNARCMFGSEVALPVLFLKD